MDSYENAILRLQAIIDSAPGSISHDSELAKAKKDAWTEMMMANLKIMHSTDSKITDDTKKKAKENFDFLIANKGKKVHPRHNIGPWTAGPPKTIKGADGALYITSAPGAYDKLKEERSALGQKKPSDKLELDQRSERQKAIDAVNTANVKNKTIVKRSGSVVKPEKNAEEEEAANLVAAARRQGREQTKMSDAIKNNVKRDARQVADNIKESSIDFDKSGVPKYHPVMQHYGIDEEKWNNMDPVEKLLHVDHHYNVSGALPENRQKIDIPMPDRMPEVMNLPPEEAEKQWHASSTVDKHRHYGYLKLMRAAEEAQKKQSTPAPAPAVTSEPAQPTPAPAIQPTTDVKKSLDNLYDVLSSLRSRLVDNH